jgi:hypothetical protein
VWLLMESDDTVPRKATGKVDARALRHMLRASLREQT